MSGATTRNVIRGLIAIAAVASIVLPPVTIDIHARFGTTHNEVSFRDAVSVMRACGEWPALIVGIIGGEGSPVHFSCDELRIFT